MRDNQGKQTELVKREIVNYITDHRLTVGKRIPTQAELRKLLGVGNAVISRAIQALTEDGILESKSRSGVIVRSTEVEGYGGRNIGIICHHDMEYTVAASMMQALSVILNQRACSLTLFVKGDKERKDVYQLKEFRGAERAIQNHEIDGLFTTVFLDEESEEFCRKQNLPLCCVGFQKKNPEIGSAKFDISLTEVLEKVHQKGFRRPMLVHMGHPYTQKARENFMKCAHLFDFGKQKAEAFCQVIREDASSSWDLEENMNKVMDLVHRLTGSSKEERPDIFVILDDIIAGWVGLELQGSDWNPEILHTEHLQIGSSWPLRTRGDYYECDIQELAKTAADLLLSMIKGTPPENIHVKLLPPYREKVIRK